MESKNCVHCDKVYFKKPVTSKKDWLNSKYCSQKCHYAHSKGKTVYNSGQFKKGQKAWNTGLPLSKETKEKLSFALKGRPGNSGSFKKGENCGEEHRLWKGDDAGIKTIHAWVYRHKKKPLECELCGRDNKPLEWANIDHKYKRNLDDYMAVCRSCHRLYDIKNNGYKIK